MQKGLLIKAAVVGLIFLLLQIPLKMIGGMVVERAARQQDVVREISTSSYGSQVFAGPILTIPYIEEYNEVPEGPGTKVLHRRLERVLHVFPSMSSSSGAVGVSTKSRGLFKARVYDWNAKLNGHFAFDGVVPSLSRSRADSLITWGVPFVSLPVSDPRGLDGAFKLQWGGQSLTLERGSGLANSPSGLHTVVPNFDPAKPQRFNYAMDLKLHGTESLAFLPLAAENSISLQSTWPHPSFGGQFLPRPETQTVSKDGFNAQWHISALSSNAQQQMGTLLNASKDCPSGQCIERVEVRFVNPVDIYSLTDRALKYGFLFIALTFVCLILVELLKELRIHPAQYLLGGLALGVFFLLLIALSEHFHFWVAYLAASIGCILLLGYYLTAVLRSVGRGLMFSAMLTALYGALYGLLISEDNALLLGALLVFGFLAATMSLTRHLNWYTLTDRSMTDDAV